jgi:hypothetical protein
MDIDAVPTVERSPATDSTADFFETVANSWSAPTIHTVNLDGESFYLFESRMDGEFGVDGMRIHTDDILYAHDLDPVEDEQLRERVQQGFVRNNSDEVRETEATDELKKIVKKKKS